MNNVTTFDNFPPFATNGSRNMNTEAAKYAVGFLEGETFPAEWANYLFHGATKGISDLNTAVQSIWKENINVIQGSGQTPSSSDNTQLKTAIELMIQNAVLTANAQVLAQAKLDAHPVGSLYWSSNPTNPSTLFGGTWVQIKDRFVLAAGDTYGNGATGGAASVNLTEANLPAHKHKWPSNDIDITSGIQSNDHNHYFSATTGEMSQNEDGYLTMSPGSFGHPEIGWYGGNISATYKTHSYASEIGSTPRALDTLYIDVSHTHSVSGITEGITSDHTHTTTIPKEKETTTSSGSGTAHENMPPYVVKFCWERTA